MNFELENFIEQNLRCNKRECSFRCEEKGYYRRFGYGNRNSKIMAVFQNPGAPTKTRLGEMELRCINSITVEEMRNEARTGVSNWLFEENKKFDRNTFSINGIEFLESFYITQAHKCPDSRKEISANERNKVNVFCSENLLKREIELIQPTVVFAFGKYALSAVSQCFGFEKDVKRSKIKKDFKSIKDPNGFRGFLWNGTLVLPIPHPGSLWRYPNIKKDEFELCFKLWVKEAENYVEEVS